MNLRAIRPMTWLMLISVAICAASVLAIVAGIVMQDALWQLVGMMGIVAGAIKIAAVLIWTRIAGLGRDDYTPTPAP
ncbi:MAG: hypothetical protein WBA46_03495 [Thermomicrobiales bacterium]